MKRRIIWICLQVSLHLDNKVFIKELPANLKIPWTDKTNNAEVGNEKGENQERVDKYDPERKAKVLWPSCAIEQHPPNTTGREDRRQEEERKANNTMDR